ncbi:zinc finger BED domain-containing protein 1-like [Xiphophorus hellerii]|uniref:zinc finger BED domain-containing protein 1-like n=1 Tax=Xiphophorus hellerii TaxID=8084 RepID=UPI0013B3A61D|nr:zinc finger BED domain-containing protein 1-like [Xiphophorus hellerii]
MIVKDTQPFTIVDDIGFRAFVSKLDPNYVLPTRQALKAMVEAKYESAKEHAKAKVEKVAAVSLTSDMWTSINMDAYLAVTCHFVEENGKLSSVLLGVQAFPQSHTAENIACVKASLMEEWGISGKVTCMVTDGAPNMVACVRELKLRHHICVAHTLNLVVKRALDQHPVLSGLRAKARKLVGYFRSSTTAKEKLTQVQLQLGMQATKLMQEVETRWNSTYLMLQRLVELREPVGAALAGLHTDIPFFTASEFDIVVACLSLLSPFYDATTELSAEEHVSASKVIPLLKMMEKALQEEDTKSAPAVAVEIGEQLIRQLREKLHMLQSMSILSLATLLDPLFKLIAFFSNTKAAEAVKRLTSECATVIRRNTEENTHEIPQASTSQEFTGGSRLWQRLDTSVMEAKRTQNVSADATVEVQRYLSEANISRQENPLEYWANHRSLYPNLYKLALIYLCTPASSVPCEHVFSKAGEVVSRKRNR